MPRFVIQVSEKKRRKYLIWACFSIACSLFCLAVLLYYLFTKEELIVMRKAFYIVFALQAGWSGFEYLQKRKRKEFFLEIDEHNITWLLQETGEPVITGWDDIRWIKKEKNGAILIFRDSSFSVAFSLKHFQEEEQEQIISLLEEYAVQKQIRLVNFSETALALA